MADAKKPVIDEEFREAMRLKVEEARKAIKIVDTIERLQKCVMGTLALNKEQIKCAEILLKKAMPDLRELEVKGEVEHKHSLDELVMASMQSMPTEADPLGVNQPAGGVVPTVHQRVEH